MPNSQPPATPFSEDAERTLPPLRPEEETIVPAAQGTNKTLPPTPNGADFGDYELLDEIARGGMGVVYRARQNRLNRIVAVKMILAGQLASHDEVRRFYTEAEAAAQLDHPGIVPIYEVGEHTGQHFFSMAFIDGPSLHQRLLGKPLPPREAGEILLKVAEAVAYAHEAGILHRDLKPHNILLDRDGTPKVTDFGLAKRMGTEGLTTTGEILGTPGYMAPEQASGKIRDLGTSVDVYALGAILYACLTGRPPFQAANAMETLLQVIDDVPPPPQLLNSAVPTDLQSICLQCLEKEPQHRYATAAEMAADLRRWLDGELVQASGQTWRAALIRTLSRSRDDVKLRTWGTMLMAFAVITFLAEIGIFMHAWGGPPFRYEWAILVRAAQFLAMAVVFIIHRASWRGTATAASEHMWSLWLAFLVGCHLIVATVFQLQPIIAPSEPVNVLACYPYFAVLSGMLFIALGRSFWGYCYAFGGLFFALSLLFPSVLPLAPLLFGGAWGAVLLLLGIRLRGLPEH